MRNLRSDTASATTKTPVMAPILASSPTTPYLDRIPVVALKILGNTAAIAMLAAEGRIFVTSKAYRPVSTTTSPKEEESDQKTYLSPLRKKALDKRQVEYDPTRHVDTIGPDQPFSSQLQHSEK
jgi:hypothetical protein